MGRVSRVPRQEQREHLSNDFLAEQLFGPVLSQVSRTLWPEKTAANIAVSANCSVRAAEFYLSGQREWSGDAIAAIVSEILRRHSMRNVRVTKR